LALFKAPQQSQVFRSYFDAGHGGDSGQPASERAWTDGELLLMICLRCGLAIRESEQHECLPEDKENYESTQADVIKAFLRTLDEDDFVVALPSSRIH
jgi:hypothetical protein